MLESCARKLNLKTVYSHSTLGRIRATFTPNVFLTFFTHSSSESYTSALLTVSPWDPETQSSSTRKKYENNENTVKLKRSFQNIVPYFWFRLMLRCLEVNKFSACDGLFLSVRFVSSISQTSPELCVFVQAEAKQKTI